MITYKKFDNGLRYIGNKREGAVSVTCGIMVKTGCINENEDNNGISHFIEHNLFKGTKKRSAFEISDFIDGIGAQINAYTGKEMTCYYTKSTKEHLEDDLEVLSDIFFNSTFLKEELDKEKGVIIEEINMSEDSPEDLCFDLLSLSEYGNEGLGRTILGSVKNVKSFTEKDIRDYMDRYYTAQNVVISIAGNIDNEEALSLVEKYFADKFEKKKCDKQVLSLPVKPNNVYKCKKIEQSHVAFGIPVYPLGDKRNDALKVANTVFGGGMSSRLFQKIREEMGLCYNIYSYCSHYKDSGMLEIYSGVATEKREEAVKAIVDTTKKFLDEGVTEKEFLRGKEQIKSSFIMAQESTSSLMQVYGRYLLFLDEIYDYEGKIKDIDNVSLNSVNKAVKDCFNIENASSATLGPKRSPLKL